MFGTVRVSSLQEGSTPLIAASWGGHLEVVKVLVARGAAIELVNNTVCWH